tara:strand:- start:394 stop:786 length:393 start_codon:yes stop_codon:yes gene_type:complete
MEQRNFLNLWKLFLVLPLLATGCSSFQKVLPLEVKTIEVERKIPAQTRPKSISLNDIYFYVVTDRNFEEFKQKFEKENGDLVFYAVSVRDYETLALNMAEIKRYIQQQQELIVYYEKAIEPKEKKETPKE